MTKEEFTNIKYDILQKLGKKYRLECVNIKDNVALIGSKFSILFEFGRGETDITYFTLDNEGEIFEYPFNNFIISSFDTEDRKGILREKGMYEYALADLKIIVRGLENHWSSILKGKMDWLKLYQTSKYYYKPRISEIPESIIIKNILNK